MSGKPLVSIITPSFNTGRFVSHAVESVLTQDYRNIEYLVMDGGSTDNTISELRRFGDRIKYVSQPDHGQADALNKGFHRAKGQIFAWLNADDTYAPQGVSAAVEYLWSNPDVACVYGDAMFIDAHGDDIAKAAHVEPFDKNRLLHYSDFIAQPAAFFRRSAFEAVGGIDASLNWAMDYDLWLKMAVKGLKFAYLPKHLANYRWLADTKTASGGLDRLREIEQVAKRYADGTHGYQRLELLRYHLGDAAKKLKRFRLFGTTASLVRGATTYLGSARAMRSSLQPKTWKIVLTGQKLRKRAIIAEKAAKAEQLARSGGNKKSAPPAAPLAKGGKPLPPRPTGKAPAKK